MTESNEKFLKQTLAGRTESVFGEPETKSHETLRAAAEAHIRKTLTEYCGQEMADKVWNDCHTELMKVAEEEIENSADFHLAYEKQDITEESALSMLTLGNFTKEIEQIADKHYKEMQP